MSQGHSIHFVHYCSRSSYRLAQDRKTDADSFPHSYVLCSLATVHANHLSFLRKGDFDIVYGNSHVPTFCSLLGKLLRVPLVFDMHGAAAEELLLTEGKRRSLRFSSRFVVDKFIDFCNSICANRIACVSHSMIEYLCASGVPVERTAYVPNGVDTSCFTPQPSSRCQHLREELNLVDKFVFGYVGGTEEWQGVRELEESANCIKNENVMFLVVGGNRTVRGGNLIHIPRVQHSLVKDYYSMCDVLVLPRPHHPATQIAAPTKFPEYAASGRPILTTDVGDAAALVREYSCGKVISDCSEKNLSSAVNHFVSLSKEDLKQMGRNSRKLAEEEFDWRRVGERLKLLIGSL